jgi:surfeit locus 1 family protein
VTTFKAIFSRRWIIATIVIVLGMVLLARLGVWQWDRMLQKRAFNTMMAERWRMEPFDLNRNSLPSDLEELEYRRIQAQGEFDYDNQILISNQVYKSTAGYVVVTPFVMGDNRAVLVARGWVPANQAAPEQWAELEEPPGAAVLGLVRQSQAPRTGDSTPPPVPQREWYRIDIPAIQAQMPYKLEAAYIEQMPEPGRPFDQVPIRAEPVALDEGNHLSYSIQWFTFALVLGFGYIMLVRFQEHQRTGLVAAQDVATAPMPVLDTVDEREAGQLPVGDLTNDESKPVLAGDPLH